MNDKLTFNLKAALIREAMGAQWQPYRGELEWYQLEEVLSGNNEEWNRWVEITPSLANAATKIRHFRDKKMDVFRIRYDLSAQQINDLFYTLIGYAPEYGAYMLSIGPYVGEKEADEQNRFGYFVWRLPSGTQDEITKALGFKIKKYWQEWSEILTPEDFQIVVANETDQKRGTEQWKHERKVYNSLDPSDSEGQQLYTQRPILGTGTEIMPNAKGLSKMMLHSSSQGNWGDLLQTAINNLAAQKNLPQEQLDTWMNDFQFVKSVYEEVKRLQQELVERGVVPAGMLPIPNFLGDAGNRHVGSKREGALKTSTTQRNNLMLKQELIQTIVSLGTDDPEAIAAAMNARRSGIRGIKAKGEITTDRVVIWIQEIQNERVQVDASGNSIGELSYEELLPRVDNELEECLQGNGYTNLESAVRMACLYYADVGLENIDPLNRAKLSISISNPPALQGIPEQIPAITSEELTEWRANKTKKDEGIAAEELASDEGAVSDAMGGEGEGSEFSIDEINAPDVINETTPPSTKSPVPVPPIDEENEPMPPKKYTPDFSNLMAKTIVRLVRLAEELDNEGKGEASEEIHNVIRKYHKRLR